MQLLARIVAPLLRTSLISIWLYVFTSTMFELAASELLYPPGESTMPVLIVNLFGTFRFGQGMALAMLNVGLVALALIIIRLIPWLQISNARAPRAVDIQRTDLIPGSSHN